MSTNRAKKGLGKDEVIIISDPECLMDLGEFNCKVSSFERFEEVMRDFVENSDPEDVDGVISAFDTGAIEVFIGRRVGVNITKKTEFSIEI